MPQTIDNLIATWANSSTAFTGIKFNVQGPGSGAEQSAAGSLLMDLQVGGSSRISARKSGRLRVADGIHSGDAVGLYAGSGGDGWGSAVLTVNSSNQVTMPFGNLIFSDIILTRRGTANLRLGAADAAGSAIAINSVATNQLTLASNHGLTTGAAIIITGAAAPSGTTLNVRYYARVIAAAVIELYSTYDQATAASGTTGIIAVTTAGTSASVRFATPFQSFGVQDFTGTDIPGQPFIIRGSRGTGTGPGGDIVFQVAPAGTAGLSQNALVTALSIRGDGAVITNTINSSNYYLGLQGAVTGGTYWASATDGALGPQGGGFVVSGNRDICWTNAAFNPTAAVDLRLARDDANKLALRNGTSAQRLNIYGTYTAADNFERLFAEYNAAGTAFRIGTEKGTAGGTARSLEFQTDGVTRLSISDTGVPNFTSGTVNFGNLSARLFTNAGSYISFEINNGNPIPYGYRDALFFRDAAGVTGVRGANSTTGGALSFIEQTAPTAPATNGVRIYAEDNGSGKTRLMARFGSGDPVQIAIEP